MTARCGFGMKMGNLVQDAFKKLEYLPINFMRQKIVLYDIFGEAGAEMLFREREDRWNFQRMI